MQGKAREMETDENRTDDGLLTLSSSRSTEVSLMSVRVKKAGLDKRRKGMLGKVPDHGDHADFALGILDIKDLAYLTAATGDEFAILRGRDKDILWHGTPIECDVLSQYETELKTHKLELFAHSHPGEPIPEASLNDRKFLRYIGQKKSRVISGMTGVSIEFEDTF